MDLPFLNRAQRRRAGGAATPRCSRAVPVAGLSVLGLAAFGSIVVAGPAAASSWSVTDGADSGPGTLRAAVQAANLTVGVLDTITIDPAVGEITLTSNPIRITDPVTITGAGASALMVRENGTLFAFYVIAGTAATTTISGLTITGGSGGFYGGAVYSETSDLVLDELVMTGNSSGRGGAVFASQGLLTVTGSTISGNDANAFGGGVAAANGASVTVTASTISGNTAGYGAGVSLENSSLLLSDSTVSDNPADTGSGSGDGGGFWLKGSQLRVERSTVSGNSAVDNGGALFDYLYSSVTVVDSTISDNEAFLGGALITESGATLSMQNSTVTGNRSGGPAIFLEALDDPAQNVEGMVFDHVTIAANDAYNAVAAPNPVALVIANSIIVGSVGVDDVLTLGGSQDISYSVLGTSSSALDPTDHDQVVSEPMLAELADNGGPTLTMLPAADSPVLDAGDPAATGLLTDQRGADRVAASVQGGLFQTDIGAVEVQVPVVVPVSVPPPVPVSDPVPLDGGGGIAPQPVAPSTDATLAATGAATGGLLPAGLGLAAGGGVLAALGRRRRRRAG